jgi:hypothetical protein
MKKKRFRSRDGEEKPVLKVHRPPPIAQKKRIVSFEFFYFKFMTRFRYLVLTFGLNLTGETKSCLILLFYYLEN